MLGCDILFTFLQALKFYGWMQQTLSIFVDPKNNGLCILFENNTSILKAHHFQQLQNWSQKEANTSIHMPFYSLSHAQFDSLLAVFWELLLLRISYPLGNILVWKIHRRLSHFPCQLHIEDVHSKSFFILHPVSEGMMKGEASNKGNSHLY